MQQPSASNIGILMTNAFHFHEYRFHFQKANAKLLISNKTKYKKYTCKGIF